MANSRDDNKTYPLHDAARRSAQDVSDLLSSGAEVNALNSLGETPLFVAARYGNVDVAKILLVAGADVNIANFKGQPPLHIVFAYDYLGVCDASHHYEVAKLLIEHGAHVNRVCSYGQTPLYLAAHDGNLEIIQLLLSKGAEIDHRDLKGKTPLCIAAEAYKDEVLELLIKAGADHSLACSLVAAENKNFIKFALTNVKNESQRIEALIGVVESSVHDNQSYFSIITYDVLSCEIFPRIRGSINIGVKGDFNKEAPEASSRCLMM